MIGIIIAINWKVTVWQMRELKLVQVFFMNTCRKNGEEYEPATISNFQRRVVQNKKKRRIVIEKDNDDRL